MFEKLYKNLNSAQKKAVDTIEGPVMVIAGPGTGKTTILTLRIANILKETDTPPSGILALTFTEAGVKAMRSKLRAIIGVRAEEVRIHTFHGFARSIIQEFDDHFPVLSRSAQITDVEAEEMIRSILKTPTFKKLRPLGEPDAYVRKIIGAISDAKKEAWTPEMLSQFAREEIARITHDEESISSRGATKGKLKADALKQIERCERTILFAQVYGLYEEKKKNERKMDFDDLIFELLKTIREDALLLQLIQEKFLYILVDEHQDTNNAQNLLIRSIADFFDTPNLFVVGDEKQAIYRFQGASVSNFLEFTHTWDSMEVISLTENYRSHQSILDASFALIEHNYEENEYPDLRIRLSSKQGTKQPIDVRLTADGETEEAILVRDVTHLLKQDIDATIALIVRNNAQVTRLVSLCEEYGIPATAERGVDIFTHSIGTMFFALVTSMYDPSRTDALAETFARGLWGLSFIQQVEYINALKKGDVEQIEKHIPVIKEVQDALHHMGVIEYLIYCADVSGLTEIITETPLGAEVWRGIIDLAQQIAQTRSLFDPRLLIEALLEYKRTAEHTSIKIKTGKVHAPVTILTAHSSKGLEFDYVFIPYATTGVWLSKPRGSSFVFPQEKKEDDSLRDERRLFYVALTRARKHVYISASETDEEGNSLTVVRFVDELDQAHVKVTHIEREQLVHTKKHIGEKEKHYEKEKIEYTKRILTESGLSVTALNHFISCPREFFYESILKIPQAPSASSEKGNAMHEALARVWKDSNKDTAHITAVIQDTVKTYMKKSLLPSFEKEIIVEELTASAPIVASVLKEHFSQAGTARAEGWSTVSFSHTYQGEEITIPLHGKLDVVVEEGDEVRVFDYKTREGMSENEIRGLTKNSDGSYFRQLIFYTILLEASHRKNSFINPSLVFVKPDDKGRCPIMTLSVTTEDVSRVKEEIKHLIETVWSETLLTQTCDNPECTYCK